MAELQLGGKIVATQTGNAEPVIAGNVTGTLGSGVDISNVTGALGSGVDISNVTGTLSNNVFPAGHPILLSESSSTSAVASVDFDNTIIVPDYKIYILRFHRLIPTADNVAPFLSFSANNGIAGSFLTCRTGRIYTRMGSTSSNGGFEFNASSTAGVELTYDNTDYAANKGLQVEVTIFASQDSSLERCNCNGFAQGINHDGDAYIWRNAGHIVKGLVRINFMRLKYASGTIASHSYSLLGIK